MYRDVNQYKTEKGKFTYGLEIENVPNNIAEQLNKEFKLGAEHARYHVDGTWYSQMLDFPCVLFDRFGYILFKTKKDFLSQEIKKYHKDCEGIYIGENHIQVDKGIYLLPGYVLYPYMPNTLTKMKFEMVNAEKRRIFIKEQEVKNLNHTNNLRQILLNSMNKKV